MIAAPARAGRRRAVRSLLVLATLALALVLGAPPAAGHAVLVSSTPGDGAQLDEPPASVSLEFSESITADLGGLRVFDADGEQVDRGAVEVADRTLSVGLAPDLPEGAYVVAYRIISADGHPIRGGTVFSVGDAEADPAALTSFFPDDDRQWEIAGAVGRWLAIVGALGAVGGAAFVVLCRRAPATAAEEQAITIAAAIGAVGAAWAVPVQAALGTGQGVGALFQGGVMRAVLADGFGIALVLATAGLATIAATVRRWPVVAMLGSVAVLVSFPLVGHTRVDDVAVGSVADVVHVGAAAVWTGGLALLLLALRRTVDGSDRARLVGRFSTLATASVVVVGVTGLVLSWTEVRSFDALTSTTYGWTLVAKIVVVGLVVAAGAYNNRSLVPAVVAAPDDPAPRSRMAKVLGAEIAGVVGVVAITAVLVNVTPAYVDAGIGQIHSEVLELDGAGSVQVVVDPSRAGHNSVHLYFYGPDGRPAEIAEDVRIELSKPGDGIGPIVRQPFRAGPAHFQWDGTELVSVGRWELRVVARIDRFSEAAATADVLVG